MHCFDGAAGSADSHVAAQEAEAYAPCVCPAISGCRTR